MRDGLPEALLLAFHKRHAAPPGFDSRAEDCLTCAEDAGIALEVVRSSAALVSAICLLNVEAEGHLPRERWKLLRELLIELEAASDALPPDPEKAQSAC